MQPGDADETGDGSSRPEIPLMGKPDKRGRSKGSFVMVMDAMMESPAWLDLSGSAVKVFLHLIKRSKGNNGFGNKHDRGALYLSERQAASDTGLAKGTVAKAFNELVDHGFLRLVSKGHFDVKNLATTWRLTHQPYPQGNMGPTNEWRKWVPPEQNTQAQKLTRPGPKAGRSGPRTGPIQSKNGGKPLASIGSESGPHIDMLPQEGASPDGGAEQVDAFLRKQIEGRWTSLAIPTRERLARSAGLSIDEVRQYLDGSLQLSIGKQMALRAAAKEAA